MKTLFTILAAVLLTTTLWAQSPEKISYQAVIRDGGNNLVVSSDISIKISILKATENGEVVYTETHSPTTNANGLVSLKIGDGDNPSGTFSAIDWAIDDYFIKTETDPSGGTSYSISSTGQLLSVPYALYAKTANETDPRVPDGTVTGQMQYWDGTAWITVAVGNQGDVLTFINGTPTWIEGGIIVSPTDAYNPTTGKVWMDRNLGASQVATSSSDSNAYGDLYQWGRGADGHESRTSGTTTTRSDTDTPGHDDFIITSSSQSTGDWRNPQNNDLWQGVDGTNNPCPSGYRLPTMPEWTAERQSWSTNNAGGAFASPLKLPKAGTRDRFDGAIDNYWSYWSSTVTGIYARALVIYFGNAFTSEYRRSYGFSVRCIKDY